MVYLLQLFLPSTSCLASNKKLQVMLKARKSSLNRQSKHQIPNLAVTQIWGLSYMESTLTIINMLRVLMEKVDNAQEDVDYKQREANTHLPLSSEIKANLVFSF